MAGRKKPSVAVVPPIEPARPKPTPPAFLMRRAKPQPVAAPETEPDPEPEVADVAPEDEEVEEPAKPWRRPPLSRFYRNVKVLLEKRGMSERAACLALNLSPDYLRNYRTTRAGAPLAPNVAKFAELLDTTADELLGQNLDERSPLIEVLPERDALGDALATWTLPRHAVPRPAAGGPMFLMQTVGGVPDGLASGDTLLVDTSELRSLQTGHYIVELRGEHTPVHIRPILSSPGKVSVALADGSRETVQIKDLKVVGKVRARWTRL